MQRRKRQRPQDHKLAPASQVRNWEAHGKQHGKKKPAKAGQAGRKTLVGGPLAAPRSHLMMAVMRHPQGPRSNGVYDVGVLAVVRHDAVRHDGWNGWNADNGSAWTHDESHVRHCRHQLGWLALLRGGGGNP